MAGEWLKLEASTPEKQEVFSITVAMGWSDPDLTVGKLFKVWRWFDQQTIDGNAPRVTLSLLDHIVGVSGFAQAMCDAGWLACGEAGVSLPNFDRHNGKTAKERALTAKRVAKHKSNGGANDNGNGAGVSGALPREEKKREEKEDKPKTTGAAAPGVVIERRQANLDAIEDILPTEPAAKPAKAPSPVVPDWMPMAAWAGYLDMRKKQKKPPTPRAVDLLVGKLDTMRAQGIDIAAVLDTSTQNCWTDVYPPKVPNATVPNRNGRPDMMRVAHLDHSSTVAAAEASRARMGAQVPLLDIDNNQDF